MPIINIVHKIYILYAFRVLVLKLRFFALIFFCFAYEDEPTSIEAEPIIELVEDWEDVRWYNITGMALAGCPSAKDVAKIASQKSIDKQDVPSTSEEDEESTEEEEEEDENPKAAAEKRAQREIKLLISKIKNFK